jgi:HAD superfamily phosphatase (TIGR01668 family)
MKKYIPSMVSKSIFDIDYKKLSKNGIKFLLFDLDNTIIPDNVKDINDDIRKLFKNIKALNIKPMIFSNSIKPNKVKRICSDLDIEYIYFALKPLPFKFNKVLKKYNLNKNEIAIIGDQLLTDVKGGNRVGIMTILVKPVSEYDAVFTRLNRIIEKKIMSKNRSYYE